VDADGINAVIEERKEHNSSVNARERGR
jgi:hypothetical protein